MYPDILTLTPTGAFSNVVKKREQYPHSNYALGPPLPIGYAMAQPAYPAATPLRRANAPSLSARLRHIEGEGKHAVACASLHNWKRGMKCVSHCAGWSPLFA
jgi:hypothetical protein